MAIEQAPEGLGRIEKIAIYALLAISSIASCVSLYFSDIRSNQLEKTRLNLEESLLDLERDSRQQIASLNEVKIALAEQEKSKNLIDQRIRLLELVQTARPSIDVFTYKAHNSKTHASVSFCFVNKSDFPSHVSVKDVNFQAIGSLGEVGETIQPYLFSDYDGVGEVMPKHSISDTITFRLKDFDRENGRYNVSVQFLFSSPEFVVSEITAISDDLGVGVDPTFFEFSFTSNFRFLGGHFATETYRECG